VLLEQEQLGPIEDPEWSDVESALRTLDADGNSFVILSSGDNYVQVSGSQHALTLEIRLVSNGSFRHFKLGRSPAHPEEASVRYGGGTMTVQKSEILNQDDCDAVFRRFFHGQDVPAVYVMRDITSMFA
jgi:hypothetical protein